MLIAKQKKNENIAEYLLYMWQIEDIIRANELDISLIRERIIDGFVQSDEVKKEIEAWYRNLIEMMRREGVQEQGHLQINTDVLAQLTDLHRKLLNNPQETNYISSYYKTLPFIVELRSKNPAQNLPEIETCFAALYGFLLLRVQQKEISGETQAAVSQISSFLRLLSKKYKEIE
ncbi:MAG: DUF4924 family protein [Prevotella sp.]|jgi:hypothetical protein|nr:DUF4924 family protein [Prevotella sp.]